MIPGIDDGVVAPVDGDVIPRIDDGVVAPVGRDVISIALVLCRTNFRKSTASSSLARHSSRACELSAYSTMFSGKSLFFSRE